MSALLQTTGDAPGFIRCAEVLVERGRNGLPSPLTTSLSDLRVAVAQLEPTLRIPAQHTGLDPLTGLADRRWFEHAVAQSESQTGHAGIEVGVIALDIDGLAQFNERDGRDAGDGMLLLTAELLHNCSRRDDLAARLVDDDFALLAHTGAAGLDTAAARLRELLLEAGVPATVGAAMRGERGGLSAALRTATGHLRTNKARKVANRTAHGAPYSAEVAASQAVAGARSAIKASVTQAQATGILMQWHHCSPERALLELAYQAHELGMPVTAMSRLLVAVASGVPLADEDLARGIELDRSLRLAARVENRSDIVRVGGVPLVRSLAAHAPMEDGPKPGGHLQPIWTVRPPNAASGLLALSSVDGPARSQELQIAGRYQGAAGPVGSGGDWFDAFALPEGTAAVVLGDVAGHDALAAATMMQLRTLLRGLAVGRDIPPSAVLRKLDRYFVRLGLGLLATVFFGWVETDAAGQVVLRWCSAGHLPPVLLTADGEATVLDCDDDLLLGLGMPVRRGNLSSPLPPGSTLLLYSDGLVETRRAPLDEGMARLCAAARPLASLGVTELCDTLLPAMVGVHTPDDVTLMAIRVPVRSDASLVLPRGPVGVARRS